MLSPFFVSHMKGCIRFWHGKDLSNFLLRWRQCSDLQGRRDFCTNCVGWINWEKEARRWTGPIDPDLRLETYIFLPQKAFLEGGGYTFLWSDFMTQIQKLEAPLTKKDLEKFL